MKISTTRFGELNVPENLILKMTKPVLGFEMLRRYIIVETEDFEPFKWLQSVDDPEVAFVIINPLLFFPDYTIEVNPKEIEELKVENVDDIITHAIVSIPQNYTRMTINLQGPILINSKTRLAKQLVLVNSSYGIKHKLFESNVKGQKTNNPKKVLAQV